MHTWFDAACVLGDVKPDCIRAFAWDSGLRVVGVDVCADATREATRLASESGFSPESVPCPPFALEREGVLNNLVQTGCLSKGQAPKRSTLSPDLDHLDPHQAAASPGVSAEFFTGDVTDVTYTALSLRVSAYGIS